MTSHTAQVHWQIEPGADFAGNRYSRAHAWIFDGGVRVPASSSPAVVPLPLSSESAVDPEEAFVASLSSCHMLWFLAIAARRGLQVDEYLDQALGTMGRRDDGRTAMLRVELRPRVRFGGERQPSHAELEALHHAAHESCYIASSVSTEVVCHPQASPGEDASGA